MKKFLTSIFVLTLSFGAFAQQFNLGKVSFATDSVWIISGNGITQIWSDAVQTDSCSNKKISFDNTFTFNCERRGEMLIRTDNSWKTSELKIDCRPNPGQKGNLFSWLAVSELKDVLCPAPWRVPTIQDFIDLDIAIGGYAMREQALNELRPGMCFDYRLPIIRDKLINDWGGAYGGFINSVGQMMEQGLSGYYWTLSEKSMRNVPAFVLIKTTEAHYFRFESNGYIDIPRRNSEIPPIGAPKGSGFALRCVRDN